MQIPAKIPASTSSSTTPKDVFSDLSMRPMMPGLKMSKIRKKMSAIVQKIAKFRIWLAKICGNEPALTIDIAKNMPHSSSITISGASCVALRYFLMAGIASATAKMAHKIMVFGEKSAIGNAKNVEKMLPKVPGAGKNPMPHSVTKAVFVRLIVKFCEARLDFHKNNSQNFQKKLRHLEKVHRQFFQFGRGAQEKVF